MGRKRSKERDRVRLTSGGYPRGMISNIVWLDAKEKKDNENRRAKDEERRKQMKEFIRFFVYALGKEYPNVVLSINESLFACWKRYDFNKDIPQANIQIEAKLKELGFDDALDKWKKLYQEFKKEN